MPSYEIGKDVLSVKINHVVFLFNEARSFSPKRDFFSCKVKTNHEDLFCTLATKDMNSVQFITTAQEPTATAYSHMMLHHDLNQLLELNVLNQLWKPRIRGF